MRSPRKRDTTALTPHPTMAADIVDQGFSVCKNFIDPPLVKALIGDIRERWNDGQFDYAGVGQGVQKQRCPSVRSDRVHWLDDHDLTAAQTDYLDGLEQLRLQINRATMMGLFEWEGHLAMYPTGSFYRRHLDVFRHARERKISTILYLNQRWTPGDGGELRLYLNGTDVDDYVDIAPEAGTLVTFLSEDFYHEVLPAHQERMSITGWFRTRSSRI